jgi:hypothetical protein
MSDMSKLTTQLLANAVRSPIPTMSSRAHSALDELVRRLTEAEQERSRWIKLSDGQPPPHVDCLFRTDKGKVYHGSPCYGMHAPYWTTWSPENPTHTIVLNDFTTVTHWMPVPHFEEAHGD